MKKTFTIILVIVAMVGGYLLLNNNYEEAVNSCVQQGNNLAYCEYHAG